MGHRLARMQPMAFPIWHVTYRGNVALFLVDFFYVPFLSFERLLPNLKLIWSRYLFQVRTRIELVLLFTALVLSYPIFFNFSYKFSEGDHI